MTQVFRFDREARLQEILRAARMLGERPEVLAVVLFGSLARQGPRGATAMSDADILILLSDTPLSFGARLVDYRLPGVRGLEVFPYTWDEALALARDGLGPIRPALEEGLCLFERAGAWARFREGNESLLGQGAKG